MKELKIILVSPGYSTKHATLLQWGIRIIHRIVGGVVRFFTRSKYSHVAIGFENVIVEALAPKVRWSAVDKYADEPIQKIIILPVTDKQYDDALYEASKCVGLWYGLFDDCVTGGIHDTLGDKASEKFAELDNKNTTNCSALGTRIVRRIFPYFLADHLYCEITPEVLGNAAETLSEVLAE